MRKLLVITAAFALVGGIGSALPEHAAAQSAKSPFCALAGQEKNLMAWDEYYHCMGTPPRARPVVRRTAGPPRDPYCTMAAGQKNLVSWNAFYHCHPTQALAAAPAVHRVAGPPKDPYCSLAGQQKNLIAWDEYYGCMRG